MAWKIAKRALIADQEEKLKLYERWSKYDVDKMLDELKRKDKRISELQHTSDVSRRELQHSQKDSEKLVGRLKKDIGHEKQLKLQAYGKLDAVRGEMSVANNYGGAGGGMGPTSDLPGAGGVAKSAAHWRDKYSGVCKQAESLEFDKEHLVSRVRQLEADLRKYVEAGGSQSRSGSAGTDGGMVVGTSPRPTSAPNGSDATLGVKQGHSGQVSRTVHQAPYPPDHARPGGPASPAEFTTTAMSATGRPRKKGETKKFHSARKVDAPLMMDIKKAPVGGVSRR
jgi:hypothetical protein